MRPNNGIPSGTGIDELRSAEEEVTSETRRVWSVTAHIRVAVELEKKGAK